MDMSVNTGEGGGFEGPYHADYLLSKLQELPRIRQLNLRHLELQGKRSMRCAVASATLAVRYHRSQRSLGGWPRHVA